MAIELWDAYDREGNSLGFDLVRGEPICHFLDHQEDFDRIIAEHL